MSNKEESAIVIDFTHLTSVMLIVSIFLGNKYQWTHMQSRNRVPDVEKKRMVTGGGLGEREEYTGRLELTHTHYYIQKIGN